MPSRSYPTIPDGLPAPTRPISFVCVEFCDEYRHNILKSDCVHDPMNQFIHVDNRQNLFFDTLGAAICHGIAQARHELVAIVHEDVILPKNWQARFEASLRELEEHDPDWALLGAVGRRNNKVQGHWSDPRGYDNTFGDSNFQPVVRLDEQLLILRKSGPLAFDPHLPSIHNIGFDLALAARQLDRNSYALNAPTIHKFADRTGALVQGPDDSAKIVDRKSRTYLADRACSDDYLNHKWRPERLDPPLEPLEPARQGLLEAPLILIGRGGGGTRLLSTVAQDCGLFIGNRVAVTGDSLEMVPAVYQSVFRRHLSRDPWLQAQITPGLQRGARQMLDAAGWPPAWGFKLPETLLVLPDILAAFPKARFVELTRDPAAALTRRTHMTARMDNHIGRTALRLAYDHFGLPRERLLSDSDQLRSAVTTLHQEARAETHLRGLGAERYMALPFDEVIADPAGALQRFAAFSGLEIVGQALTATVDPARAAPTDPAPDRPEVAEARALMAQLRAETPTE